MRSRGLPTSLQRKVLSYFIFFYNSTGGVDEVQVLDRLPPHLYELVTGATEGKTVSQASFLQVWWWWCGVCHTTTLHTTAL